MTNALLSRDSELTKSNDSRPSGNTAVPVFTPPVDVYQNDSEFILVAEMPGVNQNNIEITLEREILTITGLVERENFEGYKRTYSEAPAGC